jgi:hypothetical protein
VENVNLPLMESVFREVQWQMIGRMGSVMQHILMEESKCGVAEFAVRLILPTMNTIGRVVGRRRRDKAACGPTGLRGHNGTFRGRCRGLGGPISEVKMKFDFSLCGHPGVRFMPRIFLGHPFFDFIRLKSF